MTDKHSPYKDTLENVVGFLLGAESLHGFNYGERPAAKPNFWWREHLRNAVKANENTHAAHKEAVQELIDALESFTLLGHGKCVISKKHHDMAMELIAKHSKEGE